MTQSIDTITVRDGICGRCSVCACSPERIDRQALRALLVAVRAAAIHDDPQVVAGR